MIGKTVKQNQISKKCTGVGKTVKEIQQEELEDIVTKRRSSKTCKNKKLELPEIIWEEIC